jgi:hypothetical protein
LANTNFGQHFDRAIVVRQHVDHEVGRELEIGVWNGLGQSVFMHERDVGPTVRLFGTFVYSSSSAVMSWGMSGT